MPRGRVVLEAWEQRILDDKESVHVTVSCAWCSWSLAGDLRTAREAHRQHRTTEHPDRAVKHRRTRHRPYRVFRSMSNLDDNIAAAREQGAATWEGAAD